MKKHSWQSIDISQIFHGVENENNGHGISMIAWTIFWCIITHWAPTVAVNCTLFISTSLVYTSLNIRFFDRDFVLPSSLLENLWIYILLLLLVLLMICHIKKMFKLISSIGLLSEVTNNIVQIVGYNLITTSYDKIDLHTFLSLFCNRWVSLILSTSETILSKMKL